jgi:hypothetical protein
MTQDVVGDRHLGNGHIGTLALDDHAGSSWRRDDASALIEWTDAGLTAASALPVAAGGAQLIATPRGS